MKLDGPTLDSICYRRNFLTEVIARIDFLNPLQELAESLAPQVSQTVLQLFPIAEPKVTVALEVKFGTRQETKEQISQTREWVFHGLNRDKSLTIARQAMFVRYTTYRNYEALREEFLQAVSALLTAYEGTQVVRLGLRYINNIDLTGKGDPLDWSGYLDERMLSILSLSTGAGVAVTRAFHNLELSYGDGFLRYQYGLHNPDYPAPVRRKVFVLDLDAYSQTIMAPDELARSLDRYHGRIQELFELSITETLRGIMNATE